MASLTGPKTTMPNYWKIAPGRQAQFWRDCVEKRCIPINWLNQSDLSALSVEQIESLLTDREQGAANSARSVHAFVHDIQPGDRVFANAGKSSCKGIGIVTSDYLPPKHKKNPFRNQNENAQVRLVDWQLDASVEPPEHFFNIPTVQLLKPQDVVELKLAYLQQYPKLAQTIHELIPLNIDSIPDLKPDEPFLPNDQDERVAALQSVKLRRGQAAFRSELLVHFQRRCVVSDCQVEEILEAAHIHPYRGTKDHHVENGLLLRADLHTLFDLSLLAIDPQTHQLLLAPHVAQDPYYEALANKKIQFPKKQPPNRQALEARFKVFLALRAE
jgi:hypothetical protein